VAYNYKVDEAITYWKQVQAAYVSVYRHMGSVGYKGVTFSEAYQVHLVDHQGLMLNYWNSVGPLRVPVESYYYMY